MGKPATMMSQRDDLQQEKQHLDSPKPKVAAASDIKTLSRPTPPHYLIPQLYPHAWRKQAG